jgi:hypothetical protein
MPVNIDDPSRPTLSDPSIELVEELRLLKARAKDSLARIQAIETSLSGALAASALGKTFIAQTTEDNMLALLGAEGFGIEMLRAVDPAEAQDLLGMTTGLEVTTANPGGITLPNYMGNFTFKLGSFLSTQDANQAFSFETPFTSQCFGVVSIGTSAYSSAIPISFHTFTTGGATANRDDGVAGSHTIYYLALGI